MHNLNYIRTSDVSALTGFYCGVYEMDKFIQENLQNHLDTHPDLRNYIITENNVVVALCTLKNYKLTLPTPGSFIETEYIEYLAVRRESQNSGIGREIILWIISQLSIDKPEVRHITVDAFISDVTSYSAVPFYKKCGFKSIQKKHPLSETIKMLLTIPPKD